MYDVMMMTMLVLGWQTPWSTTPSSTPAKARRRLKKRIQVVIDIDDTVKSSGNVRVADVPLGGIDGQYERGAFYPGVFEFVAQLARCGSDPPEPVAVLTARAREFKFALELRKDDEIVRRCGVDVSRVLYGSAHEWLFQDFKGWRKFTNFELLADRLGDLRRPQREYVFVGDTGEMDRQAGELMLSRHPTLVKAVFLHCVGTEKDGSDVFVPVDYAIGGGRVYHFRTYVGAAAKACKAGYLDRQAFDAVVDASFRDLKNLQGDDDDDDDSGNKLRDLRRDLGIANAMLQAVDDRIPDHDPPPPKVVPVTRLVPEDRLSPFTFWRAPNRR